MNSVGIDEPYGGVIASPFEVVHIESAIRRLVMQIQALVVKSGLSWRQQGKPSALLASMKQAGLFAYVIKPAGYEKICNSRTAQG